MNSTRLTTFLVVLLVVLSSVTLLLRLRSLEWEPFLTGDGPDQCDIAQIARNISEGRGFVTIVGFPFEMKGHVDLPIRETRRAPLLPHLIALSFKLYGPSDLAAILPSVLFGILAAVLVFFLAARLGASPILSFVISSAYVFHPLFLQQSTQALTPSIQNGLFLILLLILCRPNMRGWYFSVGTLCALLFLTNNLFIFVLPSVFVFLLRIRSAKGAIRDFGMVCLSAATLSIGVSMSLGSSRGGFSIYNYSLLYFTRSFPSLTIPRSISQLPIPTAWALAHISEILEKYTLFLGSTLRQFWAAAGLFGLALLAFIILPIHLPVKGLRLFICFLFSCLALFLPFLVYDIRYYYHFLAPLLLLGTASAKSLLERCRFNERAVGLILVSILITATFLNQPSKELTVSGLGPRFNYFTQFAKFIDEKVPEGTTLISNVAWPIAWYTKHPSVLIPNHAEDIAEISRASSAAIGIFLDEGAWNDFWLPAKDYEDLLKIHSSHTVVAGRSMRVSRVIVGSGGQKFSGVLFLAE